MAGCGTAGTIDELTARPPGGGGLHPSLESGEECVRDYARVKLRRERSLPVLEKLKRWLLATSKSEPPRFGPREGRGQPLNHWETLTRFVKYGRVSLDDNLCDQQLRDNRTRPEELHVRRLARCGAAGGELV